MLTSRPTRVPIAVLLRMRVYGDCFRWPSVAQVDGHIRKAGLLQYATVLRTGHLVPTVVPKVFKQLLSTFIDSTE